MDDLLRLEGRVAFITGGGSGIGRGAALAMANAGARIAVCGLPEDPLDEVVGDVEQAGGEAKAFLADVSDPNQIQAAIDDAAKQLGRLDIVFANAGINGLWAPVEEITPEDYDKTMNVNLKGTFLTIKYATPHLRKQGKGVVLVTSSVNGTRIFSNTGATVYSTTKAGQVAMAKMLAIELGNYGIRVNVICPGAISTNIGENTEQRHTERIKVPVEYPEGPYPLEGEEAGNIDQVGRLALFLASDMADHITGEVVYIDAGQSLVQG